MSDDSNTNTIVLLIIAGGLYYMTNLSNSDEKEQKEDTNSVPYILAFVIVFSLKKEIEDTISRERIYTLIAITAASYLNSINADILKIFASVFASLIMLPAIQENQKK